MNAKMKSSPSEVSRYHQPRFGAAFDLFTQKGSMMTSTHVQNAMAILQEPVTVEVIFFSFLCYITFIQISCTRAGSD